VVQVSPEDETPPEFFFESEASEAADAHEASPSPVGELNGGRALSNAFRSLIDQVIQQHMMEVAMVEWTQVPGCRCRAASPRAEPRLLSKDSMMSPSPARASGRGPEHSGSASSILCRHKMFLREIEASEVLEAFEDAKVLTTTERLRGRDSARFSDDGNTFFGSTIWMSSTREEERYEGLTRCQKVGIFLESTQYEMGIAFLLLLNVLWMAMEVQIFGTNTGYLMDLAAKPIVPTSQLQNCKEFFQLGELVFNIIFALDVGSRILILGRRFWKAWLNYIDVLVTFGSVLEVYFLYSDFTPFRTVLFRLLRVGKLLRAVRMVSMSGLLTSLHLLIKCLASSRDMLFGASVSSPSFNASQGWS